MTLTLRFSDAEAAIRSVGDPPNGIVAISSHPDHVGFLVDGAWEPAPRGSLAPGVTMAAAAREHLPGSATPLAVADVAAGADVPALRALWEALTFSIARTVELVAVDPRYLRALEGLVGVAREFVEECG